MTAGHLRRAKEADREQGHGLPRPGTPEAGAAMVAAADSGLARVMPPTITVPPGNRWPNGRCTGCHQACAWLVSGPSRRDGWRGWACCYCHPGGAPNPRHAA